LTFGIIIFLFTFYFSLKEGHKVKDYFTTFFPFPKEFQEKFYDRFGQVTNSVVYGQIIVGLAQGIISGIGYYMFGVPNALILTVITTIVGVIPVIGPWLVWIPLDVFLFLNGDITRGTQLLIYGLFVINWIDTILSPQIVARTAKMNPAIALIGAIGGTYVFGIIGFFIGPLLLAYLILLVELYRNKKPEDSILIKEVPEPKISEDKKQS
jgi:predicted PurR-regulated permease PerM